MGEQNVEILEFGKKVAFTAGQILMDNFGSVSGVSEKADGSLVTNVDVEVDEKIVSMIRDKFPLHSILTEESPEIKGNSEYRWVIDPLDGTHNYLHGIDIFGVSICVTHLDKPIIGIVYLPAAGQLYHCEKGNGAYLDEKRIKVSNRKLKDACITHNSSFRRDRKRMFEGFGRLVDSVFNIRMLGCCVRELSNVAEGKVDADIEYNVKPWDIYGGALLIEEAGGKAADFSGRPWYLSNGPYILSNGLIHEELRKLLGDLK